MSDLEAQVGSIMEVVVNTTVIQFTVFMTSLARETVEKICQLFHECSELLRSEGVAEIEDLRKRLEVAETELKLVLSGRGGQKGAEDLTQDSSGQNEDRGAPINGAKEDSVQISHRSARKSFRVVASGEAGVKRSPIIHLWKGRTYEDSVQPVIIKEEGLEAFSDQMSLDSGQCRDQVCNDDDDPDYQFEAEDPGDGDPGYTSRPKRVAKPKSNRGRAKTASQGQSQQPLSCKHCRKTFTKLLQLKAHQAIHEASAEKPFHCSQCGRGFSFQRSLNTHMLLHTATQVTEGLGHNQEAEVRGKDEALGSLQQVQISPELKCVNVCSDVLWKSLWMKY
ncbi:hypothetical protein INR49_022543 [Caranx melampygus]|nr:hypothetical protein INR49_022543 [Caranx melampygus]